MRKYWVRSLLSFFSFRFFFLFFLSFFLSPFYFSYNNIYKKDNISYIIFGIKVTLVFCFVCRLSLSLIRSLRCSLFRPLLFPFFLLLFNPVPQQNTHDSMTEQRNFSIFFAFFLSSYILLHIYIYIFIYYRFIISYSCIYIAFSLLHSYIHPRLSLTYILYI